MCVCAQLDLPAVSLTHGPTSIARQPGGTAYQLLQITTGSYMVLLEVDVIHPTTGVPYGVYAWLRCVWLLADMCVFDSRVS